MIRIVKADGSTEQQLIADLKARAAAVNQDVDRAVAAIMNDVRIRGYEAVRDYSIKFDRSEPYEITKQQLEQAYLACDRQLIHAMEHAAANLLYHILVSCIF